MRAALVFAFLLVTAAVPGGPALDRVSGVSGDGVATPPATVSGPSGDLAGPATDVTGPATDVTGLATDVTGPATDVTGPATDVTGSTPDVTEPTADTGLTVFTGVDVTDRTLRERVRRTATQVNESTPNVSRVLTFPPTAQRSQTIRMVRIEVGGASAIEAAQTAARLETLATARRIRATEPVNRPTAVQAAVNELAARSDELRASQQRLLRQYAENEISDRTIVVGLARIHAIAGELQRRARTLGRIGSQTETVNESVVTRTEQLALELQSLRGPVRSTVLAAMRGERPPERVYVAASRRGVVVSMITNGTFVREAYIGRLWADGDDTPISAGDAQNVTAASYPEIWSAQRTRTGTGFGSTFRLTVPHAGGRLNAYVRGNREVARAVQRIPIDAFPAGELATKEINGLVLQVNRTYPGGPMRLRVIDAQSGEPIDARIRVTLSLASDARRTTVGTTGDDGVLWTLSPGGSFVITAQAVSDGRVVQFSTAAADPTTVANARSRLSDDAGPRFSPRPISDG